MSKLQRQADFVEAMFLNLILSVREYMKNEKESSPVPMLYNKNYMNRNCGKYALKRKTTSLRQELLNLERMLEQ